uniref:Uncharacterized protein n=1 Tax=Aegilops tauschii TaxID=37682 RepID=R7WBF7_AEGTA
MRRHSVSRILNSLIWLAYLSADSMAIFVLGHLAVHASSSYHLLIFWAPFLLLHMGGQDAITAFSMQDNDLWQRHLLGLVTQASVAGYVISISSWQDSLLLAATVLMFLSGVFKATIECATIIPDLLNMLKYSADRSNAYIYVGAMLARSYERVYTKVVLHFAWVHWFKLTMSRDYQHRIRTKLALDRWTAMRTTIDSTDMPTSVLIWHIATEICYLTEENNNDPPKKTRVSRDLSNYIMYLVFTCGVMPTGSSKLVPLLTHKEIREAIGPYAAMATRDEAIRMVLEANNREKPQSADTDDMGGGSSQPATQVAIRSPVVPRACIVANELNTMPRDGRWGLIGDIIFEGVFRRSGQSYFIRWSSAPSPTNAAWLASASLGNL